MKGGMQSGRINSLFCKCGKPTSRILQFWNGEEISIHFTKKSTYWHIYKNKTIKRTFKKPKEWE